MSLYFIFALMIVVSIVWLVWFLYRPLKNNNFNLEKSNIELSRQKQAELHNDLAQGLIDARVFDQAQADITQTLAIELTQNSTTLDTTQNKPSIGVVLFSTVFISVLSLGIYQALSPKTIALNSVVQTPNLPLSLEQSVVKVQAYIKDNPNDARAWQMLGLTYFELNDLEKSLSAYEKSYQLEPKNPRLLVEYASTIATKNNDDFSGRPIALIKQALTIEPNAPDALYMAGLFATSQQDFNLAKALWQRALNLLPDKSPDRLVLTDVLKQLAIIMGDSAPQSLHSVTINVIFSAEILASRANDYVMIYIKAAQGRPMPIAIRKIKLKDFSSQVILTDDDSVIPSLKLSQSGAVIAVVRLSQSGLAMRQTGDLQVLSTVIEVSDNPDVHLKVE